jgi:hypothetical protein
MAPSTWPDAAITQVAGLKYRGVHVELIDNNGQCYALARGIEAPSPPWDRSAYEILVAIPLLFDEAGLDGFYLALPYQFNNGQHQRVNGQVLQADGRSWQLVSWHYPDGKPWRRDQDSLESHLAHCRGFFLNRGATNAI